MLFINIHLRNSIIEFKVCRQHDLFAGTNEELHELAYLLANSVTR